VCAFFSLKRFGASRENVKSSILHALVDKQKSRENALGSHFDVLLEGKLDHKQKRRENAIKAPKDLTL